MTQRDIFMEYLTLHFPDRHAELALQFQSYFDWLCDINTKINLISRQTPTDDYWTLHFLDSILLTEITSFTKESVLDFGTGGGLPGIPLAILYPHAKFHLLDSRRKKLEVIADACETIGIENVELIHGRVEEISFNFLESFNAIVSRSVKIEPQFKSHIVDMLIPGGKAFFYKSVILDDMKQFHGHTITDLSRPELGTRKIVTFRKKK